MSYSYFIEENEIKNLNKDLILVILLSPEANICHQSLDKESCEVCTKGLDEVIAKPPIWLKLYQMNIWNPSRKDKKSFFQNMN